MKGSRDQVTKQNKQGIMHLPKPDIRDNLDSRENKEANFKSGNNKAGKKKSKRTEG